jgi:hypothetical protein
MTLEDVGLYMARPREPEFEVEETAGAGLVVDGTVVVGLGDDGDDDAAAGTVLLPLPPHPVPAVLPARPWYISGICAAP